MSSKSSRIKPIDRACHEKQMSTNFASNAGGNMAADTQKKCKLMLNKSTKSLDRFNYDTNLKLYLNIINQI